MLKLIPGDQSKTFKAATLAKLSPDAKMSLSAELYIHKNGTRAEK
jgi:hypothetical protein